jgi:peptidoglycan pentaglycine glycine transferase (the first glycine)
MEIRNLTQHEALNSFVATSVGGQLLQTWEWGEFKKSLGQNVWRLGVYDNDVLLAAATIIEHQLPFSRSYLYTPYGPVFFPGITDQQKELAIQLLLSAGRDIIISTKTRTEIFFRIEPRVTINDLGNFFFNFGLKKATAVQPQDTAIVDLKCDTETLLERMHAKTRYNIKVAERHGVEVREAVSAEDFLVFWNLLKETAARDKFHTHPLAYYKKLWESCSDVSPSDISRLTVKILLAEKDNYVLAAGMFSFFGDRVLYLHGASASHGRNHMAPYALHWKAMELARQHKYSLYDFHGILPTNRSLVKNAKEQHWAGITRFKIGFGAKEVNYVGAWDMVYDNLWYVLYQKIKRLL